MHDTTHSKTASHHMPHATSNRAPSHHIMPRHITRPTMSQHIPPITPHHFARALYQALLYHMTSHIIKVALVLLALNWMISSDVL